MSTSRLSFRSTSVVMILSVVGILMACSTSGPGNDVTRPAAPTNLEASTVDGEPQVVLTWDSSGEGLRYSVYRSRQAGDAVSGTALETGLTEPGYTDVSVANGTRYYYQVTAMGEGESTPSNEVSAIVFAEPPVRP